MVTKNMLRAHEGKKFGFVLLSIKSNALHKSNIHQYCICRKSHFPNSESIYENRQDFLVIRYKFNFNNYNHKLNLADKVCNPNNVKRHLGQKIRLRVPEKRLQYSNILLQ